MGTRTRSVHNADTGLEGLDDGRAVSVTDHRVLQLGEHGVPGMWAQNYTDGVSAQDGMSTGNL